MKPKIKVLGYYGAKNIGDEAYKLAFPFLFPEYDLTFTNKLTGPEETVILGGGDVLNPHFLNQLYHAKHKHAMSVNSKNVTGFDSVIARDKRRGFQYLPDFAFILSSDRDRGKTLIKQIFDRNNADLYNNLVVVVMNSFLVPVEDTLARDHLTFEKVCYDLARLCDSVSASFMMLPFGNGFPRNDRIANSAVYMKCKFWKKNVVVYDELSVQDTLDICAAADAMIATRLHASIFSCIGGTPFVDLTHHDKTTCFLETIDRQHWGISYWHMDIDRVKTILVDFLTNDHRTALEKIASQNRKMLENSALQPERLVV